MVQITVRSIANNHSPGMAAALMFRDQHGYGTGSGCLSGLPGSVDLKACAAIADEADPAGCARRWRH